MHDEGRDDIVFVLHGDGGKRAELEMMVKGYKLNNVVFSNLVPNKSEIARIIAGSDVCMTIYRAAKEHTWSPNKMFDSLAAGKPVITTDYVAKLNNIVRPVADESLNAAPLYLKAVDLHKELSDDFLLFFAKNHLAIVDEKNIYPLSKDFSDIAAAILELNMLFAPDTSVIHIASIKKIPVFGVYVKYNTRDMIWSPYNTKFDCVITEEPTLKNVTLEEVKKKFIPFLEQTLNG